MFSELALYLLALGIAVLMFASAVSSLDHDNDDFSGIQKGSLTFLLLSLGMVPHRTYEAIVDELVLFFCVCLFIITTAFFLLNLLVAQLTCAYGAMFEDMVGYARLGRIRIIVETMPKVPKSRWNLFVSDLHLDQRIEFNQGDIGLSGGIQLLEPANANPINTDIIQRFGGSTSVTQQWPEEDQGADTDRFDRIEKLVQKTMQRGSSKKGRKEDTTGTSSSHQSGTITMKSESEDSD